MRNVLVLVSLFSLAVTTSASADENDPRVKRAWKAKCASCHGEDGKGDTEQAKKKFGGPLRDLLSAGCLMPSSRAAAAMLPARMIASK